MCVVVSIKSSWAWRWVELYLINPQPPLSISPGMGLSWPLPSILPSRHEFLHSPALSKLAVPAKVCSFSAPRNSLTRMWGCAYLLAVCTPVRCISVLWGGVHSAAPGTHYKQSTEYPKALKWWVPVKPRISASHLITEFSMLQIRIYYTCYNHIINSSNLELTRSCSCSVTY